MMAKVYIADRYVQTLQGGWNLLSLGQLYWASPPTQLAGSQQQ